MLIRIWLFGFAFALISCNPIGDNFCEVEERYPVNITEFSLKNVTVRNYKWCMGFPPRCSFYTTKVVKVPEVREVIQTQRMSKCCPGFVENSKRDGCIPCKKCFEGTCGNGGNCICNSGFRGEDCADACEPMRWGVNCQDECLCEHGTCNPRTGRCDCPTGWFGPRCEVPCLEGFYGKHCINRCSCGERDLCSPETGECSKKPPRQQEHQSTRAIHYMTKDVLNLSLPINTHKSTPSFKKYYTFDMELDPHNITAEDNEIIDDHNMSTSKTGRVTSSPEIRRSRITTTPTISSTKTVTGGHNDNKLFEESAESTTEINASEINHNIGSVAIIDENESLENVDRSNSDEHPPKLTYESSESEENHLEKEKHKIGKERDKIQLNEKIEPTKTKMKNKLIEHEIVRTMKKLEVQHFNQSKAENSPYNSNHSDVRNKSSINQSNPSNISELFPKPTSSPDTLKKDDITHHHIEKILSPTSFKPDFTTIPTDEEIPKNAKIMEDNELQKLDVTSNILTSRESTTISSPILSTFEPNVIKKGILPLADVVPSTKSIDMGNDMLTPESTENQISMKEAYERRNGNEPNGGSSSEEFDYSTNNSNITTHMSVIALIAFILVLILSGIIFAHSYLHNRKKENTSIKIDNQSYGGHTVSVYTHSIFHTPLPDPPIFENPVFKSPTDSSSDQKTFQTHVICSLNFPDSKEKAEKEYMYDHPPSTGSYRAASIPEPPETVGTPSSEPVYDEIPSTRRGNQPTSPPPSYKSSCLYMNTCGKTRF